MSKAAAFADLGTVGANGYIEKWEEYWLEVAQTIARKSKDPRCRVGAVIVSGGILVSTGFNGLARHVFDDPSLLEDAEEKLKVICHAEHNAILNAARMGVALKGAEIFVTKFPCVACCVAIVQAGIVTIHTHDAKYWDDDPADKDHSRKRSILKQANISVDAPFHPDYAPRRVSAPQRPGATPSSVGLPPDIPKMPLVKSKRR
jgi:dCMP deaminase